MGLVGRDGSLAVLTAAMERARAGCGGLVMVRAHAGMGVTALLDAQLGAAGTAGLRTWRVPVLPSGLTTLSGGVPDWAGPGVVVIDDLHRADDPTLLALHALAEELPRRALLVVTGRRRGVAEARFALLDRLAAVVHDLPPLDEGTLGREPGAGGNPWLLTRAAHAGRAAAVTAWAAELAGADTSLLRWAALLDEAATVDTLAAVAAAEPEEVLAGVERLGALGLIEQHAGQVRLRYPMLRVDLAATSAGLRAPVARRLAERGAADEMVLAQLGGSPMDAWTVAWLTRTADRLAARPVPALVELLHRAVAWLPPGDSRQLGLRPALAEALLWSGRFPEARRAVAVSLAAAVPGPVRQRLQMVLARAALAEIDPVGACAALEPERVDGRLPARLAVLHAHACLQTGDLAGMAEHIAQASQDAATDPVVALGVTNLRAVTKALSQDLAGAIELLDQAEALLDTVVYDRAEWLTSRLLRAVIQDLRFDAAARDTVEQARPVALTLGAGWQAWLHTVAALIAHNTGRWDEALAEIDAAMAMPEQYGMARALHGIAALILLHRGDLGAARTHLESAERAVARGTALFYEQLLVTARATLADLEGEPGRAVEIVRTVADGAVGVHPGHAVSATGGWLVRIAVNSGDQELARQLTEEIRDRTGERWGGRGALMFCQGLVEGDAELLLAAAHQFADAGSPVAAAYAGDHAALLLAASGRPEDARAAHRAAVSRFELVSAAGDIDRAVAALRAHGVRLGATGSRRRPKHGWASLTQAEHRVAELVAQGLTDREIAARLFLSVRTVHSHVSRMLGKLGYSSRIEVVLGYPQRT